MTSKLQEETEISRKQSLSHFWKKLLDNNEVGTIGIQKPQSWRE